MPLGSPARRWPGERCGRLTHPLREGPQAAVRVVQSGHEPGPRASAERCWRAAHDAGRGLGRRDAERAEKAQLAARNDRLRHLIRQVQRLQFGRRSEKLDPDQLNLALEDVEQAIAATEAEQEQADPAFKRARAETRRDAPRRAETRRAVRGSLPEHRPGVELVIEPENTACTCCGGAMQIIGEDRSQRLDVIPAQYRVLITPPPK